jgi:hypothetical protein
MQHRISQRHIKKRVPLIAAQLSERPRQSRNQTDNQLHQANVQAAQY